MREKPEGLIPVIRALEEALDGSFDRCPGASSPIHFIAGLEEGDGRTCLTRYITDVLYENSLISFSSGRRFAELSAEGTSKDIAASFARLLMDSFSNSFEGVVSIDITPLAGKGKEAQFKAFLRCAEKLARTSVLILFYSPSVKGAEYIAKAAEKELAACCGEETVVNAGDLTYSFEELACIAIRYYEDRGELPEEPLYDQVLLQLRGKNCLRVPAAIRLAGRIIKTERSRANDR